MYICLGDVQLDAALSFEQLLQLVPTCQLTGEAVPMEMLPVNEGQGQMYGWTLYRKEVSQGGQVNIEGQVRDRTQVSCVFLFL